MTAPAGPITTKKAKIWVSGDIFDTTYYYQVKDKYERTPYSGIHKLTETSMRTGSQYIHAVIDACVKADVLHRRPLNYSSSELTVKKFPNSKLVETELDEQVPDAFPTDKCIIDHVPFSNQDRAQRLRVTQELGCEKGKYFDLTAPPEGADVLVYNLSDVGANTSLNAPEPEQHVIVKYKCRVLPSNYDPTKPVSSTTRDNISRAVGGRYNQNSILIVSADEFRSSNEISYSISWERTVQSTLTMIRSIFKNNKYIDSELPIHLFRCIVITYGLDGALIIFLKDCNDHQIEKAHLILDPSHIEGEFSKKHPGRMRGVDSNIAAAIAYHIALTKTDGYEDHTERVKTDWNKISGAPKFTESVNPCTGCLPLLDIGVKLIAKGKSLEDFKRLNFTDNDVEFAVLQGTLLGLKASRLASIHGFDTVESYKVENWSSYFGNNFLHYCPYKSGHLYTMSRLPSANTNAHERVMYPLDSIGHCIALGHINNISWFPFNVSDPAAAKNLRKISDSYNFEWELAGWLQCVPLSFLAIEWIISNRVIDPQELKQLGNSENEWKKLIQTHRETLEKLPHYDKTWWHLAESPLISIISESNNSELEDIVKKLANDFGVNYSGIIQELKMNIATTIALFAHMSLIQKAGSKTALYGSAWLTSSKQSVVKSRWETLRDIFSAELTTQYKDIIRFTIINMIARYSKYPRITNYMFIKISNIVDNTYNFDAISALISLYIAGLKETVTIMCELLTESKECIPLVDIFCLPCVKANKYESFSRREVEDVRNLQRVIKAYLSNKGECPLSIGVFGLPGEGKSFLVKEVVNASTSTLKVMPVTYNLSQFIDKSSVTDAFEDIQDIALKGSLPLVFWDEFDSALENQPLGWWQYFIGPMQDGEYFIRERTRKLPSSIFVFAGSSFGSFESLETLHKRAIEANKSGPRLIQETEEVRWMWLKGSDFKRRLTFGLDVGSTNAEENTSVARPTLRNYHFIKRAVLLRFHLQKRFKNSLFFEDTDLGLEKLNIDNRAIKGFIEKAEYYHGAGSVEQVIRMLDLSEETGLSLSQMPASSMLRYHVDPKGFEDAYRYK